MFPVGLGLELGRERVLRAFLSQFQIAKSIRLPNSLYVPTLPLLYMLFKREMKYCSNEGS